MIELPVRVEGLGKNDLATFKRLCKVWEDKKQRNELKTKYYSMKNRLKDLGIAVPPELVQTQTVIGWPAKAVDYLSARSIFDGFVFTADGIGDKLNAIMNENNFGITYHQATTSELVHSCSFITVSKGGKGEPGVIVSAYSATNAAAEYDYRRKRIKDGFVIVDKDEDGNPTAINMYTDEAVHEIRKNGAKWSSTKKPHKQGRPLMEPMVYRPSLDRPFGKSRINRAVMSITDSAVRTALRTEVSAEFFTSPQKYLLGAESTIFEDKTHWDAYLGAIMAVSKDEDGDVPKFGQLAQMSMQPHVDYMRSLAARFAGETAIPVSSLGVIHDNPSSAEAIYAAKEDLIMEADSLNKTNGSALRNVGTLVIAILQDKAIADLTDEERSIKANFRNPAMPSIVSQADAMCKIAAVAPWIAETDVFLEELGFDEAQRDRLMSDKRKIGAGSIVSAIKDKVANQAETEVAEDDGGKENG